MRLEFQKGFWCGYKGGRWTTAHAKITYDKLLHSSTNMDNPGLGLDTQSGIIACHTHCTPLVIILHGVFTVPVTGVWRVSFSLESSVTTLEVNIVYIYHNQQRLDETKHYTHSEYYVMQSTGGRELITRAERGDTFHLGTTRMEQYLDNIITCFEFVSL